MKFFVVPACVLLLTAWARPAFSLSPTAPSQTALSDTNVYQWSVRGGISYQQTAREANGTFWYFHSDYYSNPGIVRISPTGIWTYFKPGRDGVPSFNRSTFIAAHNGILWVLVTESRDGPLRLYKYDGKTWTNQTLAPALYESFDLNYLILRADPTGALWLFGYGSNSLSVRLNADGTGTRYRDSQDNGFSILDIQFSATGQLHLLMRNSDYGLSERVKIARLVGNQFESILVRDESQFVNKREALGFTLDPGGIWVFFGIHGASRYAGSQWTHLAEGSFLEKKVVKGITVDAQKTTWFSLDNDNFGNSPIGLLKQTAQNQRTQIDNFDAEAGVMWSDDTNAKWILSGQSLVKFVENPAVSEMTFGYIDGGTTQPTKFTTTSTEPYTERIWYLGDHSRLDLDYYRYESLPELTNDRAIQYQYQKAGRYRVQLVAKNAYTSTEAHLSRTIIIADQRPASLRAEWLTLDSLLESGLDELVVPGAMARDASGKMLVSIEPGPMGLGQRTSGAVLTHLSNKKWEKIPEIDEYNRTASARGQIGALFKIVRSPSDGAWWLLPKTNRFNHAQTVFRVLNGKVTAYPTGDANGIYTTRILDLVVLKDGTVWVVGFPGRLTSLDNGSASLSRFDGTRWTSFFMNGVTNQYLTYFAAALDSDGKLWLNSSDGLVGFDGKAISIPNTRPPGTNDYQFMAIDRKNRKWLLSEVSPAILLVEGSTATKINLPTASGSNLKITSLLIDDNDVVWVGTTTGLASYNGSTWKTYLTTNSGIPANYVTGLGLNASNQLWVGTSNHNERWDNGYGFLSLFTASIQAVNTLAFNVNSATVPASATTQSVTLTATKSWNLTSSVPWITSSLTSGSGTATLNLQVQANSTFAERIGKLTATDATGQKAELILTQAAAVPTASASFTLPELLPGEGGTYTGSVTANTTWKLTTSVGWLTITPGNGGVGVGSVTLTVANNPSTTAGRTGLIRLTPDNGGAVSTLTVTQAKLIPLGVEEDSLQSNLVSAFPNPFDRRLTLRFAPDTGFPVRVELVDGLGRVLQRHSYPQPIVQAEMHVEGLASGAYWLQISPSNQPMAVVSLIRN